MPFGLFLKREEGIQKCWVSFLTESASNLIRGGVGWNVGFSSLPKQEL